jgi:hypothetical protein
MVEQGLTRAQAKEKLKEHDMFLVNQLIEQQIGKERAKAINVDNVKPLTIATYQAVGIMSSL